MNKQRLLLWSWHLARLITAFIWVVASLGKLKDLVKFMGGVSQYNLLSGWTIPITAVTLPGVELAMGITLLLAVQVRAASMVVSVLLVIFMAGMGWAMAHGIELDCSCFDLLGAGPAMVGWGTITRDLAMLAPSLFLIFYVPQKISF